MTKDTLPLVGAIVLCAKTEELAEIEVIVAAHFPRARRATAAHSTFVLTQRTDDDPGEMLLLATYHAMGNVASASTTGHLAMRFNPNLMIFVGTGGSLRPERCGIGDVVVPAGGVETKYYDKFEDAGQISWFGRPKWPSTHLPAELRSFSRDGRIYSHRPKSDFALLTGRGHTFVARAMSPQQAGGLRLAVGLETWKEDRPPEIHVDAKIFSWEMVLGSSSYRDLLTRELDGKAIAVDMESYGFLSTANLLNQVGAERPLSTIIVRGISDICGEKVHSFDQGSNRIAMRNATTVACRILRDGYLAP